MRNISATGLIEIAKKQGTEPVNIVEIFWTSSRSVLYSDKRYDSLGLVGKILELGTIENVININRNNTSTSLDIILDDVDGTIKSIIDRTDIHKKKVKIYQWFDALPFADRFIIFEGEISSPIIWSEGDRTVSFSIVSKLEDKEVGFSPEEGQFDFIPDEQIGKAWPLCFGTVVHVPAVQLDYIPTGVTKQALGISDPSLSHQIAKIEGFNNEAITSALFFFIAALQAYNTANLSFELTADERQQFVDLGDQFTDQGNNFLAQAFEASQDRENLEDIQQDQEAFERDFVDIDNGENFPQNISLLLEIGGAKYSGFFVGETFNITERTHPEAEQDAPAIFGRPSASNDATGFSAFFGNRTSEKKDFHFSNAGAAVKLLSGLTIRYVANILPSTILQVWAEKDFNGIPRLVQVPQDLYTTSNTSFGTLTCGVVSFPQILSSVENGWSDNIYVTLTSTVGPNTVDILEHLIETYTDLSIDTTSFTATKTKLTNYPSHFALLERKNVVELLKDIAWQARCALWISNDIVYIKYLSTDSSTITTITQADLKHQTVEVGFTETEDIVTKFVATWVKNYYQQEQNKIILRYNVKKYGTQEQEYDFFIYTQAEYVLKSAQFWLIRYANVFKRIRFSTFLNKLMIETFDTVLLDFNKPYVANTSVKALVESAQYNSDNYTLDFECSVPVRIGEMTPYVFNNPEAIGVEFTFPTVEDIDEGIAGTDGPGRTAAGTFFSTSAGQAAKIEHSKRVFEDVPTEPRTPTDVDDETVDPTLPSSGNPFASETEPEFNYSYRDYSLVSEEIKSKEIQSLVAPGLVLSGSGDTYTVQWYGNGLNNEPTVVQNVKQLQIHASASIPAGTWAMVNRHVTRKTVEGTEIISVEFQMQVPIWLRL